MTTNHWRHMQEAPQLLPIDKTSIRLGISLVNINTFEKMKSLESALRQLIILFADFANIVPHEGFRRAGTSCGTP